MRILTEAYKDKQFFVPLNVAKTEGVWVKPLSVTLRNKVMREVLTECGGDSTLAETLYTERLLLHALTGWTGMTDIMGEEVPYSPETLKMACACDPDIMQDILHRVRNVARYGEIDDQKN